MERSAISAAMVASLLQLMIVVIPPMEDTTDMTPMIDTTDMIDTDQTMMTTTK